MDDLLLDHWSRLWAVIMLNTPVDLIGIHIGLWVLECSNVLLDIHTVIDIERRSYWSGLSEVPLLEEGRANSSSLCKIKKQLPMSRVTYQ